jgi:glycosyltransferase involved in cell wall biosynthesis
MSVYNGEKYLGEAVTSILEQTFTDFEFLIIDDASTDRTPEILQKYKDPRINTIRNPENFGLTKSLNIGLKRAKGEYIARMDADDVSLDHRLETQITFMDAHPEISICGSWMVSIGNNAGSVFSSPLLNDEIITGFLFDNTIFHPTVVLRKETIFRLGELYNEQYKQAQDMEFWVRLSNYGVKFANIGEVLLKYRIHETNIGKTQIENQERNAGCVKFLQLKRLSIELTEEEKINYNILIKGVPSDLNTLENVSRLIEKILKTNEKIKMYPDQILSRELARRWWRVCLHSTSNGLSVWKKYFTNPVSQSRKITFTAKMYFFSKCLLHIY